MKGSILIFSVLFILNTMMVTSVAADSTISCYKCGNFSALPEHDWKIFNITIDLFNYKVCPPKFDHNVLEVTQCNFCSSIVDKSTQKRKIIYRGCSDKKIRLEEKRKINGERRFHVMITCQRSFCNSAAGLHAQAGDSFLGRIWRWFRLYNPRLSQPNWLHQLTARLPFVKILANDQLLIVGSLQFAYRWLYVSNLLSNFIQR